MITPGNILVIKWGALGDLIAATTAIRLLRETYPRSTITLLSNSLMREICPPGTLVDDLILSDELSGVGKITKQFALVGKLRARKFDLAINLRWESERCALLAWLSGARYRAGSGPKALRFLYNLRAPLVTGRHHEFHRHLDIIEALGVRVSRVLPYVHRSEEDKAFAMEVFSRNGLKKSTTIGIHPGASRLSKAWPAERYAEFARRLSEDMNARIVVTWGPGEQELAREVAQQAGALISPSTTIGQLAAIIGSCGLFVCNYSGPMNVAMAVETPMVALGSTSQEDWGPYGEMHRTINKARSTDGYTEEEQLRVMKEITVEEVLDLCGQRLRQLYPELHLEAHR